MKLKLSHFITLGLTSVILNSTPHAFADQPTQPIDVSKNAPITITFDIQGGTDIFRINTKPCTDRPCVGWTRSKSKHLGNYTLDVPMFKMHKTSKLTTRNLPGAKIMLNGDNSLSLNTTVNAQPTSMGIEIGVRDDGSKVMQLNRADFNAAINAENAELRNKVENDNSIKKMLKDFGATLQISSIDNSNLNAVGTETFNEDDKHNMVITHTAHQVVITGQLLLNIMQSPDDVALPSNPTN